MLEKISVAKTTEKEETKAEYVKKDKKDKQVSVKLQRLPQRLTRSVIEGACNLYQFDLLM